MAIEIKNKSFQILFKNVFFFLHQELKNIFPMYILKKGRAGIQYNAGKTEALSLETMIRMSRMTGRMGRTSGTPFPRGLSSKIAIVFFGSDRSRDDFTAFSLP